MADMYRVMWKHMERKDLESLVRDFFFTVVLTKDDCLDYINEEEYKEMLKQTFMGFSNIFECIIVLNCNSFYTLKGWKPSSDKFKEFVGFLERHVNKQSVTQELPLFKKIHQNIMTVRIRVNPPAFFQWLATHNLASFKSE